VLNQAILLAKLVKKKNYDNNQTEKSRREKKSKNENKVNTPHLVKCRKLINKREEAQSNGKKQDKTTRILSRPRTCIVQFHTLNIHISFTKRSQTLKVKILTSTSLTIFKE
jgi:hypothetical protein